jgi:uncharacterized membrane protein
VRIEGADGARQLRSALAAGVITVLGVVISVMIVALTLASQQSGPGCCATSPVTSARQLTLGAFVATFVYAIL